MVGINAVTTSGAVLGAVLVRLRAEKGMKQADLAAAVGLGASTWSRIEKGDSGLSIDQLRLASKALGVTPGLILEMLEASEKEVVSHGVRIVPALTTATVNAGVTSPIDWGALLATSGSAVAGPVLGISGARLIPFMIAAVAAVANLKKEPPQDDKDSSTT